MGVSPVENILTRGIEPYQIPDAANGEPLPTGASAGYCLLATAAGPETRTLNDPAWQGQTVDLFFVTDNGDCVVTATSPVNQAGKTVMTFADVGDHLSLVGHHNPTDGWEWRVVCNDGVALGP